MIYEDVIDLCYGFEIKSTDKFLIVTFFEFSNLTMFSLHIIRNRDVFLLTMAL